MYSIAFCGIAICLAAPVPASLSELLVGRWESSSLPDGKEIPIKIRPKLELKANGEAVVQSLDKNGTWITEHATYVIENKTVHFNCQSRRYNKEWSITIERFERQKITTTTGSTLLRLAD